MMKKIIGSNNHIIMIKSKKSKIIIIKRKKIIMIFKIYVTFTNIFINLILNLFISKEWKLEKISLNERELRKR